MDAMIVTKEGKIGLWNGIPGRYICTYAVCTPILRRARDGANLFSRSSKMIKYLGHTMPVCSTQYNCGS